MEDPPAMKIAWREWLRAFRQISSLLGAGMIALVWISVEVYLNSEHDNARNAATQNSQNLARAFEAHVVRSVQEIDKTLLILRTAYEKNPDGFRFSDWLSDPAFRTDLTWQFTIADADGILKASNAFPITSKIDLSSLRHVRVHMETPEDKLFISEPVIGKASGQLSIQLTRRISKPDGSFGGVFAAAVNPHHFMQLYDSIDVGKDGTINLVGFDGVIRASRGLEGDALGRSLADGESFRKVMQDGSGSYMGSGRADGVRRLNSFRIVAGYPLMVMVGFAEHEVFADYWRKQHSYRAIAAGVTLLILIVVGLAARHRLKLERASSALVTQFVQFHAALNNMSQGLCMFDANQRIVVCNDRYVRMYGFTPEEVGPGTTLREIVERRIAKGIYSGSSPDDYLRERLAPVTKPSNVIHKLSDGRAIAVSRQPMLGGGWVTTHEDITERQRIEAQIAYMARHDSLTDLANRVLMHERMDEAVQRLQQTGEGFAIVSIDLDGFKFVNDTMGHPVGDLLLREVAARLRKCADESSTVARLGGDEFAILRMATPDRAAAAQLAEQVLRSVGGVYKLDGNDIVIGVSMGIALAPQHGAEADALLKNADIALYRAKSEGRNKYLFFEEAMNTAVHDRRSLEMALRQALKAGEFEIYYQPILDLTSNEIRSFEALLRWHREGHGIVAPSDFISVAEDIGLIGPLGEWVIRQACAEAVRWPSDIRVSVNLSPAQFKLGNIAAVVLNALASSGLPASRLELEITESVLLLQSESNLAALHHLRTMGVRIALDDFGVGYSSLSYLTAFDFDAIKIDQRFIKRLLTDRRNDAIVRSVAYLGKNLGIETIAEGIETPEQLTVLREAGYTGAQGYAVGAPEASSQIARLLAERAWDAKAA